MAQLIAENLSVGYDGKAVLRDLNFEIPAGDYLCIIGENGSGKSTLMKTLLGLLPPISGEIRTDGSLGKNDIGYLPQQTHIQKDFPASVGEIVLSGCQGSCGQNFFTAGRRRKPRQRIWNAWASGGWNIPVIGYCQEGSSSGSCLQGHCAPQTR